MINTSENEINIKRKLYSENYINMTINGGRENRILYINGHSENIPSEILYKEKPVNFTIRYSEIYVNISDNKNTENLIIKWNSTIYDMSYIFDRCDSIISLDFSYFDTKSVIDMSHMFMDCRSLKYLNLNNFNTSLVEDMSYMFCGTKSLEVLDLNNFDTSSVKDMSYMFYGAESLKVLDLNNFATSSVKDMSYMLGGSISLEVLDLNNFNTTSVQRMRCMFCLFEIDILEIYAIDITLSESSENLFSNFWNFINTSKGLVSLNLSSFDTSSVYDMSHMFTGRSFLKSLDLCQFHTYSLEFMNSMFSFCTSLTYLNIQNFETSKVKDMTGIFYGCTSLSSINLTNFNTVNVDSLAYMFGECWSLTSLDLRNFNTSSVIWYTNMFNNCIKLEYLNIINFEQKSFYYEKDEMDFKLRNQYIFSNISDYLVYCINLSNPQTEIFTIQLSSKICAVNYCLSNWKSKQKKMVKILTTEICVDECSEINFYEYNKNCYSICPNGTSPAKDNNNICLNNSDININNSKINNYTSQKSKNENIKLYQDEVNNILYKIKNNEMNSIISDIINKNESDYIIEKKDMIIQITSLHNQRNNINNNISTIIINKECETILKSKFNINEEENILIIKYDLHIEGLNIPLIGYELFNPNDITQLDLKYCNNIGIDLNIPVSINASDLYKYNPEDDYYKDICKSYESDKNYDIIISDRKKEYNNYNLSICPKSCSFNEYDLETKKVSCQCEAQMKPSALLLEDIIDKDKLLNNFVNFESISNINIVKCFKDVISKNGLKTNIGSYIILFILSLFISLCILFYSKEYKIFFLTIDKVVIDSKNEDIENEDNSNENKKENNIMPKNNPIKKKIKKKSNQRINLLLNQKFKVQCHLINYHYLCLQ